MSGRVPAVVLALAVALAALPAAAENVVGSGVVRSDERVEIRVAVSGSIVRLPVKEGQVVRRGELLVEIDNRLAQAQVETALADVRRAASAVTERQVTLDSVRREYERNLTVPDLITQRDLELSRDAVRSAEAALRTQQEELTRSEKQLEVARENVKQTLIVAPFDGLVSRLYVREGDTPKVSDTTLLDLLSLEKLYAEVALPIPSLAGLRPGMPVHLEIEGQSVPVRSIARGVLRYIYPELDATTRMVRVKVDVPFAARRILPGMFVTATFELPRERR